MYFMKYFRLHFASITGFKIFMSVLSLCPGLPVCRIRKGGLYISVCQDCLCYALHRLIFK
uniref:Uncharacterized protein n=1 Tax=Anguilla anguilla TaxID=7936 RepID=A0A0E9X3P0_ANGAN